jgi:hypothetical protein
MSGGSVVICNDVPTDADVDWNLIVEAAKAGVLTSRYGYIYLPLGPDHEIKVVNYQDGRYCINDLFEGRSYNAPHNQVMEYIQKLHLLPTPTYPGLVWYHRLCDRSGNYCRVNVPDSLMFAYICNEYMIERHPNYGKLILPGSIVTLYDRSFPYSIKSFIEPMRRRR